METLCIRVKIMGSHDKEDGDGVEGSLRLQSFLHHQPEAQHICTEADMANTLSLPLKIYYCVWSVIKPKKTPSSAYIAMSRCGVVIYSTMLWGKLVVDTFR